MMPIDLLKASCSVVCGSNLNILNKASELQKTWVLRFSSWVLEAQMDAMKGTVEARRLQHVTWSKLV